MVILVTGANGQVGRVLQSISNLYAEANFVFCGRRALDITDKEQCISVIKAIKPDYLINLAAYTNVDLAEDEPEKAYAINATGVKNIAEVCLENEVVLIHLSTDYVFDGMSEKPYLETDTPNPLGVYGASKLKGEEYIKLLLSRYYIIRTSWIYSDFGHNFKKTILRLAETKKEISIVNDQIGCPTKANDLVSFILRLIVALPPYGIYNFCGKKTCSWYDFAVEILEQEDIALKVIPIASSEFKTKGKRPKHSVLDINKSTSFFNFKD